MAPFVAQRIRSCRGAVNQRDLRVIAELVESGTVTPVIDRMYPLADVADAFRYLERGHTRGKIVIAVLPEQERSRARRGS